VRHSVCTDWHRRATNFSTAELADPAISGERAAPNLIGASEVKVGPWLEEVLGQLGIMSPTEQCEAMEGLIAEGKEIMEATGDPDAKDAALIAAAQRIEHYEIAGYGNARAFAEELGYTDATSFSRASRNPSHAAMP
jgi:hypothetical protein